MEILEMAAAITDVFSDTFTALIERRDAAYNAEIVPLEAERQSLLRKYVAIEVTARNLEKLLPATERIAQADADALLLAGKADEAEVKLQEAQQAAHAPVAMNERQREIAERIEAIDIEKRSIAVRIFQEWYGECQHVIRSAERGLFTELLDGLESSLFAFQEQTNTGPDSARHQARGLFTQSHIAGLTADEHSAEWQAGQKWYGGRR